MFIKRYVAYLKDNPNKYWFKRKIFGWGWVPATWQGFLVFIAFIASIFGNFLRLDMNSHSSSDTIRPFIIQTIIMAFSLVFICYLYGEKPKWQWGFPKEK